MQTTRRHRTTATATAIAALLLAAPVFAQVETDAGAAGASAEAGGAMSDAATPGGTAAATDKKDTAPSGADHSAGDARAQMPGSGGAGVSQSAAAPTDDDLSGANASADTTKRKQDENADRAAAGATPANGAENAASKAKDAAAAKAGEPASGAGPGSGGAGVSQSAAAPTDDDLTPGRTPPAGQAEDATNGTTNAGPEGQRARTPGEAASTAGVSRAEGKNRESRAQHPHRGTHGEEKGRAGRAHGPQARGRPGMKLDLDRFAQDIYERGFEQGYLRGIADARQQFQDRMRKMHSGRGKAHGAKRDRHPVIVLPPDVTPEAFLDRLRQRHERR